jgi:hypothetical protein
MKLAACWTPIARRAAVRGRAWLELLCGAFLVPLIPADLARLTRLWRARIDPAT